MYPCGTETTTKHPSTTEHPHTAAAKRKQRGAHCFSWRTPQPVGASLEVEKQKKIHTSWQGCTVPQRMTPPRSVAVHRNGLSSAICRYSAAEAQGRRIVWICRIAWFCEVANGSAGADGVRLATVRAVG